MNKYISLDNVNLDISKKEYDFKNLKEYANSLSYLREKVIYERTLSFVNKIFYNVPRIQLPSIGKAPDGYYLLEWENNNYELVIWFTLYKIPFYCKDLTNGNIVKGHPEYKDDWPIPAVILKSLREFNIYL